MKRTKIEEAKCLEVSNDFEGNVWESIHSERTFIPTSRNVPTLIPLTFVSALVKDFDLVRSSEVFVTEYLRSETDAPIVKIFVCSGQGEHYDVQARGKVDLGTKFSFNGKIFPPVYHTAILESVPSPYYVFIRPPDQVSSNLNDHFTLMDPECVVPSFRGY